VYYYGFELDRYQDMYDITYVLLAVCMSRFKVNFSLGQDEKNGQLASQSGTEERTGERSAGIVK